MELPTKRTDELVPGDRVRVGLNYVFTVRSVAPNGYLNRQGEALLNVMYEPHEFEWGPGNSGAPDSLWTLERSDS